MFFNFFCLLKAYSQKAPFLLLFLVTFAFFTNYPFDTPLLYILLKYCLHNDITKITDNKIGTVSCCS